MKLNGKWDPEGLYDPQYLIT